MYCGSVVFAAKFVCDSRKTKMKLTPKEVHCDMARCHDVLISLWAHEVDYGYLGMFCDNIDDAFWCEMVWPGLFTITDKGGCGLNIRF